ncbi:MAG: transposase [Myxococcales bacterium]|nr:transposase [Myxococcales bacterium]
MTAKRHTTFHFTLEPTASQVEGLRRHVGAARFAFNQCLRAVVTKLAEKAVKTTVGEDARVPWSGFDLINFFNQWKLTADAGVDEDGKPGLAWRTDVCQQVFEEAAVDLGRAFAAFSDGRKGTRRGRPPRFPRFKKKATARASFRMRNKKAEIRVGSDRTRCIRLPKLGELAVRECTRDLRRMLRKGRAKILFATVSHRSDGRWHITLNVEAAELHPARRHGDASTSTPVGIDRGLRTFAVVADAEGNEVARIESPRPLRRGLRALKRKSKALSRAKLDSRNRHRARACVAKAHARIAYVRRDFAHRESSRLIKTHGRLVIEDLCTIGLMRTSLARAIADSGWSLFASMLTYKARWYGATLTVADRFFPSTRKCSACGHVGAKLDLSERTFHCSGCGHEADRDTNAAVNLARYVIVSEPGPSPHVAAKHAETKNAYGERCSDARLLVVRETTLYEVGKASAWRPRRAVSTSTVNTL